MQHHRIAIVVLAGLTGFGCASKKAKEGEPASPNVIEQAAGDVEHEIDQAGQTVEQVGDDVEDAAEDVVDALDG